MTPARPSPGFTLVELLAVLVLLAITASLAVTSLPDTSGSPATSAKSLAALDARARLRARLTGAQTIEFRGPAVSIGSIVPSTLHRNTQQLGGLVEVTASGRRINEVVIDRLGQSTDYEVMFSAADGPPTTLTVAGLTGWSEIRYGAIP